MRDVRVLEEVLRCRGELVERDHRVAGDAVGDQALGSGGEQPGDQLLCAGRARGGRRDAEVARAAGQRRVGDLRVGDVRRDLPVLVPGDELVAPHRGHRDLTAREQVEDLVVPVRVDALLIHVRVEGGERGEALVPAALDARVGARDQLRAVGVGEVLVEHGGDERRSAAAGVRRVVGELARVGLDPGEQVVEGLRRGGHGLRVVGEHDAGAAVGDAAVAACGDQVLRDVGETGDVRAADLRQQAGRGDLGDEPGVDQVVARVLLLQGGRGELRDGLLVVEAVQVEVDRDRVARVGLLERRDQGLLPEVLDVGVGAEEYGELLVRAVGGRRGRAALGAAGQSEARGRDDREGGEQAGGFHESAPEWGRE